MTTAHRFSTPAAFCPGQGPSSNDTSLLRSQIRLLLGGNCPNPTYQHQRMTQFSGGSAHDNNGVGFRGAQFGGGTSDVGSINGYGACGDDIGFFCTGCDASALPLIVTTVLPGTGSCEDVINASFAAAFSADIAGVSGFYEKFTKLSQEISLTLTYGAFCTTDVFEFAVIFDDRVPISWGVLIDGGFGSNLRHPTQQPFPLTWTSFELVIHSLVTDTYYQTSPQLRYTL
uniref:Uncharacterized protein n=1 Tax=viral metagenome TaxID=1070528 RepID=A0A6C0JRL7_9ZZZZ